ncbi:MAG: type II toxin-antitoxin system HicB family antitoxin [Xanthobacteraceae bacterium]
MWHGTLIGSERKCPPEDDSERGTIDVRFWDKVYWHEKCCETIMTRYVVLIDEELGGYSLTVPDLPGCTSAGSTIGEVLHNAAEAVRIWITDAGIAPTPRAHNDVVEDERVKAALAGGAMLAIVVVQHDSEVAKLTHVADQDHRGTQQTPARRRDAADLTDGTPAPAALNGHRGPAPFN